MQKVVVKIEITNIDRWDLARLNLKDFKKEMSDVLKDNILYGCDFEITECNLEED